MGIIQDYIRRMRERKQKVQGYTEDQEVVEGFHAKKMSSNERELLRYQEEERERRITAQLKAVRKKENDEIWSGRKGNPVYAGNVVANQKKLFSSKKSMFSGTDTAYKHENVTKCKNLFHGKCKK